MRHEPMSQTRARAWLAAVIWAVAGGGFVVTFFARGGPEQYAAESTRILAGAVAIALGYMAFLVAMWATRARRGAVVSDERDAQVAWRASQATMIVVLMGVFALCVGLWEAYREEGAVPVGWMWFLAYAVVIATFIVHAVATLIVDSGLGGHARG
jgi:uncharacterized membrane protein